MKTITVNYFRFLTFLLISLFLCFACKETKPKTDNIALEVFQTENNTWGYEITVNNKPFIHQTIIPSVSGNKPFLTEDDAKKTGNLVVTKMKNGENPALSVDEIKELELTGL